MKFIWDHGDKIEVVRIISSRKATKKETKKYLERRR
jgi:uncharacterized DUF497 family protein